MLLYLPNHSCRARGAFRFLACTLLLLLLTACEPGGGKGTPVEPAAEPSSTVAIVNGEEITAGPVEDILARRVALYEERAGRRMSFRQKEQQRRQLIEQLIEEALVRQAVAASTVTVSDAKLDERMERVIAEFGSREACEAYLEEAGYTFDKFRADARVDLAATAVMEADMNYQPSTRADARAYYAEHPEEFFFQDAAAVSHVLLTIAADATAAEQTQTIARLSGIRQEILAGLPFSNAAAIYSECPSAQRGGQLGYINRDETRVSDLLRSAAFALPVSNVSEIVETEFGVHLVHVTRRVSAHTAAFEEIETPAMDFLDERRRRELVKEWTQVLRARANVEYPKK
jgi:peptidyl-prolyl cis-trans isomerase C